MLVPISKKELQELIPPIATGPQYVYYFGGVQEILQQVLISMAGLIAIWLLGKLLGPGGDSLVLLLSLIAGLYWIWAPVYKASLRNNVYRRYPYSAFWRGRVLDVYITEEVVTKRKTLTPRGELLTVEETERMINVEVGDKRGFSSIIQAPLRRIHKVINVGQIVELLILSNRPLSKRNDFGKGVKVTDIYIPQHNLWVGEYPYVRRDKFLNLSQELS